MKRTILGLLAATLIAAAAPTLADKTAGTAVDDSTINASVFTGARVYHALGQDLAVRSLSFWSATGNNPRNAIYIQSAISFALIAFGAATKEGFEAMVAYVAGLIAPRSRRGTCPATAG